MKHSKARIHWADLLRGIAILSMVIFHFFYDLDLISTSYNIDYHSGFWLIFGNFIRFSFLSLVGFSLYLSYSKRGVYTKFLKHQIWRAFLIMSAGMFYTVGSYLLFPDNYIRFGILHFIAIGIIIGALLIKSRYILIILMVISALLGPIVSQMVLQTPLLLPFGFMHQGFNSMDYFPIFPWLSLILFGILFARFLKEINALTNIKWIPRSKIIEKIGQKALLIYVIHQPILFVAIYLLRLID
jgi:uncharacterized membrane protein